MAMSKTQAEIEAILVREALDNPYEGWLSDMGDFQLEYDHDTGAINVAGRGSIDVGHLAGIVYWMMNEEER